jgi:hypothetical protein
MLLGREQQESPSKMAGPLQDCPGTGRSGKQTAPVTPESGEAYINRELSWLHFAQRVMALAEDRIVPLLERVKFAGIMGMLYDEFAMKRIGGLRRSIERKATWGSAWQCGCSAPGNPIPASFAPRCRSTGPGGYPYLSLFPLEQSRDLSKGSRIHCPRNAA